MCVFTVIPGWRRPKPKRQQRISCFKSALESRNEENHELILNIQSHFIYVPVEGGTGSRVRSVLLKDLPIKKKSLLIFRMFNRLLYLCANGRTRIQGIHSYMTTAQSVIKMFARPTSKVLACNPVEMLCLVILIYIRRSE